MTIASLVAVCFQRLGPYHHARLSAAGARMPLAAIEFSAGDKTYAWAKIEDAQGFGRAVLFEDELDAVGGKRLLRRVHQALRDLDPDAVAIPGWSEPAALAALLWCLRERRPAVLMSESAEGDEIRRPGREAIKRRIVRLYRAATVGGAPQSAYLHALGLRRNAVFDGYDVVDNEHFARGAGRVRTHADGWRRRLGLPERFFLASSRFIAKKNLIRLLDGYARYRQRAAAGAWGLVLLGDGELRPEVERRIARPDLAGAVILPGFKQYDELPACYGLASAFVHASTTEQWGLVVNEAMASGLPVLVSERCGCAPDLVRDGINGFAFDPHDIEGLAALMQRVAAMADEQREAMARAGQRIIAEWGPERFADGLMQAVQAAMRWPAPTPSLFDQALLCALARRPL
jgi:1,2-diacylglycerol 3-alpha-glucosyltransferase